MLALKTIGYATSNIAKTAQGGWHEHELFAGIPIIILLGDDYQLPAQMSKGAFNILHSADYTPMEIYGRQVMLECSRDVMELATKVSNQIYILFQNIPHLLKLTINICINIYKDQPDSVCRLARQSKNKYTTLH